MTRSGFCRLGPAGGRFGRWVGMSLNTESSYYLPNLDLGYRERAADLFEELELSAEQVQRVVEVMPADLVVEGTQGIWTSTKVLRRLAWHERGELAAMRAMLAKMRTPS